MDRTRRAEEAIAAADLVVGYKGYLRRIADLTAGKELLSSGMRQETERCRAALQAAAAGRAVALVSSGDPGVYGMAGLALELRAAEGFDVPVAIVPGVSAANTAAARLGAPLMLDYAVISLSDLLVPLDQILRRLEAVIGADLVVALYNPKSRTRTLPWEAALRLLRLHRPPETPAAVATALGSGDETVVLTDLASLPDEAVDMHSVVIVGNRSSRVLDGWFVTPRGYRV
ncbi:MAG: precorrin-3B C(17)-methyltransferase [Deferrisomatales bacterium]